MTEQPKRVYCCWAGNPKGTPENTANCIEDVPDAGRSVLSHQCTRKRGHGEGGLYCKQHGAIRDRRIRDALLNLEETL
jgi:hypothetical protein